VVRDGVPGHIVDADDVLCCHPHKGNFWGGPPYLTGPLEVMELVVVSRVLDTFTLADLNAFTSNMAGSCDPSLLVPSANGRHHSFRKGLPSPEPRGPLYLLDDVDSRRGGPPRFAFGLSTIAARQHLMIRRGWPRGENPRPDVVDHFEADYRILVEKRPLRRPVICR